MRALLRQHGDDLPISCETIRMATAGSGRIRRGNGAGNLPSARDGSFVTRCLRPVAGAGDVSGHLNRRFTAAHPATFRAVPQTGHSALPLRCRRERPPSPRANSGLPAAMGTRTSHMGNGPVPDLPAGMNPLFTGLLIIATAVAGAPVAGFVIVSIASRREDSKCSLGGPPPGVLEAVARRILNTMPRSTSRPRRCATGERNCSPTRPPASRHGQSRTRTCRPWPKSSSS